MLAGIIRSLGDSKDTGLLPAPVLPREHRSRLFTILVLGMGVGGPALATVISQGISAVLCLVYMLRHYPILHMKNGEVEARRKNARHPLQYGNPYGTPVFHHGHRQRCVQTAVNSLGSMAVAAVSTGSKVSMFFCCPFDALGGTMATYAGQNVGAKKLDRVKEGLKAASLIGIIYSVIAFVDPVLRWKVYRAALHGRGPDGDHRARGDVPYRKQHVLHSAYLCECGAFYDPGNGILHIRDPRGCLRDGGAISWASASFRYSASFRHALRAR